MALGDYSDFLDKMQKHKADAEKKTHIQTERADEYKRALNNCMGTEDGIFVLRYILRYVGLFSEGSMDAIKLLDERGRKSVYLNMIRPYLDQEILRKVETNLEIL